MLSVNSLMVPPISFCLVLSVEVAVEVGTVGVGVGVVVEIQKRKSHLPSLFAGVAIAGGLLHPL